MRLIIPFTKKMAKVPTATLCGTSTTTGQIWLESAPAPGNVAILTNSLIASESEISEGQLSANAPAGRATLVGAWSADTGW
jgi:hypothetical protein